MAFPALAELMLGLGDTKEARVQICVWNAIRE